MLWSQVNELSVYRELSIRVRGFSCTERFQLVTWGNNNVRKQKSMTSEQSRAFWVMPSVRTGDLVLQIPKG